MFNFSKKEIFSFLGVLLAIGVITYGNILISYRNDRDTQRNLDISAIASGIEKYKIDYGTYPLSSNDGAILACRGEDTSVVKDKAGKPVMEQGAKKNKIQNYASCRWGVDWLGDIDDENYPKYLSLIPKDPQSQKGVSYRYESDGTAYKIYASYEGETISDYSENIVSLKVSCGVRICNVGRETGIKII